MTKEHGAPPLLLQGRAKVLSYRLEGSPTKGMRQLQRRNLWDDQPFQWTYMGSLILISGIDLGAVTSGKALLS